MLDPKTYEHPDPEDPNWPWKPGDSVEGNRPHPGEAAPVLGSIRKRPGESREEYERRIEKGQHRAQYRRPDPGELDPYELEEGDLQEDVFSAIGNLASRTGMAGKKSKNMEYWRRKGEREAADYLESVYGHREMPETTRKRILRQARKAFWAGDDASRNAVTDAVRAAVKGGDKRKADKDASSAAYQAKEKTRLAKIDARERERVAQDRRQRAYEEEQAVKQRKSRSAPGGTWSDVHDTAFSHRLEESPEPLSTRPSPRSRSRESITRDQLKHMVLEEFHNLNEK